MGARDDRAADRTRAAGQRPADRTSVLSSGGRQAAEFAGLGMAVGRPTGRPLKHPCYGVGKGAGQMLSGPMAYQ